MKAAEMASPLFWRNRAIRLAEDWIAAYEVLTVREKSAQALGRMSKKPVEGFLTVDSIMFVLPFKL